MSGAGRDGAVHRALPRATVVPVTSGDAQRGRARAWSHVVVSAVAGAVLVSAAQQAVVGLVFGVWLLVPVVVAVVFVVFALVGTLASGRPHGWRQGFTVVAWFPVVAWSVVDPGGDLGGDPGMTYAAGALVSALAACLMHPGRLRIVLAAGLVAAVGAVAVVQVRGAREDDRADAIASFGSSMRPFVVDLDGYRQNGDPVAVGPTVVVARFYPVARAQEPGLVLTVTSDASTAETCGPVLRGPGDVPERTEQAETSCREVVEGTWLRTGADVREAARTVDGTVVRVGGGPEVPDDVLVAAVEGVRPMSDRYYDHLLFGEDHTYVPELDGAR